MNTRIHSLSAFGLVLSVGCSSEEPPAKESSGTTIQEPWGEGTTGAGEGGTTDSGGRSADTATGPSDTADSGGEPADPREALWLSAPAQSLTSRVATPDVCAQCHSNHDDARAMRLNDNTEAAPYNLQHGTMMANSARDPLFWAVLSAETSAAPELTSEVESACVRCHAPLGVAEARGAELDPVAELRTGDGRLDRLVREGVSCTACHRLDPDNLGTPETWSGHWQLETSNAVYGPHADPEPGPMLNHTGFLPTEGAHMLTSEVCASCHTLQTPTVVDGAESGHTFLEQATYLEWRNSDFGPEGSNPAACQTCHFPTANPDGTDIYTRIARSPPGGDFAISPRSPFGQHFQVGGNAYMLGVIRDNADILNPRADTDTFNRVIERTRTMLQTAAALELTDGVRTEDAISLQISIANRTGHKLPTGYPARRAWLQISVVDATGATVFSAGSVDERGRILGADGLPLASEAADGPVQGHRLQITNAEEVVIYQSIMANPEGAPVFRLLQAAQMHKDNRLLPAGWIDTSTATEVGDLAPAGLGGDEDFGPGGDRVSLALSGLGGTAPYAVTVSLAYQSVSPRYLDELARVETPEVSAFMAMVEGSDPRPEVIATATIELP